MRKEITIPAAGESRNFSIKGVSLIVESIPVYSGYNQVPVLGFDQPGENFPLYRYSTYNAGGQQFKSISITGTAESAGDTVVVISVNDCLPNQIKPGFAADAAASGAGGGAGGEYVAGQTFSKAPTDAAQSFTELELANGAGVLPSSIYVTATGEPIRFAFDIAPDQNGFGFYLPADGEEKEIAGWDFIKKFQFISAVNASHGSLIVTPEYPAE